MSPTGRQFGRVEPLQMASTPVPLGREAVAIVLSYDDNAVTHRQTLHHPPLSSSAHCPLASTSCTRSALKVPELRYGLMPPCEAVHSDILCMIKYIGAWPISGRLRYYNRRGQFTSRESSKILNLRAKSLQILQLPLLIRNLFHVIFSVTSKN